MFFVQAYSLKRAVIVSLKSNPLVIIIVCELSRGTLLVYMLHDLKDGVCSSEACCRRYYLVPWLQVVFSDYCSSCWNFKKIFELNLTFKKHLHALVLKPVSFDHVHTHVPLLFMYIYYELLFWYR